MTPEQILDKHLFNKFDETDRATFIAAMKEYAEQERRKAFEAGHNLIDAIHENWEYDTYEEYAAKNPL